MLRTLRFVPDASVTGIVAMNALIILLALAMVVWFWQLNLRYRELAIRLVKNVCVEMNLQLLDQTVSLARFSLRRKPDHHIVGVRQYNFEVSSNGVDRFTGTIILHGDHLVYSEFNLPDGPVILQKKELITYH
jgi:hypothetical protein